MARGSQATTLECDHIWKDKAVEQSWVRICLLCGLIEQIEKPVELSPPPKRPVFRIVK